MSKKRVMSLEDMDEYNKGCVNNDISSYYGMLIIAVFVVYYVFVK